MLQIKPSGTLFFLLLLTSTMVSVSSNNWLLVWVGLEINLLSFIPIVMVSKGALSTEAATKYFIAQAIGSSVLLMTAMVIFYPSYMSTFKLVTPILIMAMMIKLGMPPLHHWLPHVMSSLPWFSALILASWQKVAPLMILMMLAQSSNWAYLLLLIPIMAFTGSLGGLNQSQVRPLIAFSSMSHMSWMLVTFFVSFTAGMMYFISYMLISSSLLISAGYNSNIAKLSLTPFSAPTEMMIFFLILLSLGGLPPLFGFFPKWVSLSCLAQEKFLFTSLILLISALMNLFYYIRLSFNFVLSAQPRKVFLNPSAVKLSMLSISTLPLIPASYAFM